LLSSVAAPAASLSKKDEEPYMCCDSTEGSARGD